MSTNQDDKISRNCSDLATSALHWNFIDKILNKIDEVEDCENKIKQNPYLCEKAGFVYMFNSKTKESNQLINIEIPLISDNNYLCSMSKLFSSPVFICKPTFEEKKCIPKEPNTIDTVEEKKCSPNEPNKIDVVEERKCSPIEPNIISVVEKIVITSSSSSSSEGAAAPENDKLETETQIEEKIIIREETQISSNQPRDSTN